MYSSSRLPVILIILFISCLWLLKERINKCPSEIRWSLKIAFRYTFILLAVFDRLVRLAVNGINHRWHFWVKGLLKLETQFPEFLDYSECPFVKSIGKIGEFVAIECFLVDAKQPANTIIESRLASSEWAIAMNAQTTTHTVPSVLDGPRRSLVWQQRLIFLDHSSELFHSTIQ